jgi:ribosomal-protein-serine acetyltransferase
MISRSDDAGELGFWLDEAFVGRGLVTRAAQALMSRGYEGASLHRIQLRAGVENLRSRAVAKRLGMREEGVLRGAGKVGGGLYVDLVIYGQVVDDWRKTV